MLWSVLPRNAQCTVLDLNQEPTVHKGTAGRLTTVNECNGDFLLATPGVYGTSPQSTLDY